MTVNTVTLAEQALKSYYLPGFVRQLNDRSCAFFANIDKGSQGVVGKEVVMAMRYGRIGGIGNPADDGNLPTENPRKTIQAKFSTKNLVGSISLTDKLIEASKSDAGAFADLLKTEMEDCRADMAVNISRQCVGNGTGKLATLSANSTYSTGYLEFTVDSTINLSEGMFVDIYNGASPISGETVVEVLLVDDANLTVRVYAGSDTHGSVLSTHCLYLAGNYGTYELTGTGSVLSTSGTIYGLTKATYPWLKPQSYALSGEISENAIQRVIDYIESRAGCTVDFIQCSLGVRRAFLDYMEANKQTVNSLDLKGGWSGISYNNIPIVGERFLGSGRMELLDKTQWKLYDMGDFHFMDRDGSILRSVSGTMQWRASLVRYCELGCKVPRGQGVITGITEH
jgi:hypothetical protein